MKKILYSIFALSLVLPIMASAATFSFSPSVGTFTPGEVFSVAVFVNPSAGEKITVAKLSSAFSTSGLEVVSFAQATGWIPLATPGSDLVDNTAGKLIKTGGFPARVTTSKLFGTLTLKAKSSGTAVVSIDGDSMMLDIANANKFVASTGASFTITKAIPTPKPKPKTTTVTNTTKSKTKVTPTAPTDEKSAEGATTTEETIATTTQQGQAAAAATSGAGTKNTWYYLIAAIAVLAGVLAWRKWGSKSQR